MTSRHLVDPELLPGLEIMPTFAFSKETLPFIRAGLNEGVAAAPVDETLPVDVAVQDIAGGDGQPMDVRIYRPRDVAGILPVVLQFHGGGFVMGNAQMGDALYRIIAASLGALVISVDYRLAPETRYPGQVKDAFAALIWVCDHADDLHADPTRIAIRGDSAGAGLAACLALYARDHGGPKICFQQLLNPMLDDRTGATDDAHPVVGEFVWTRDANRFGWQALLGTAPGGPETSGYAAAARANDLSGLPPTYINTGALDLFLEENMAYAAALARGGVPVELHCYAGAYHGYELNADAVVVRKSVGDAIAALGKALAPSVIAANPSS